MMHWRHCWHPTGRIDNRPVGGRCLRKPYQAWTEQQCCICSIYRWFRYRFWC